LDNELLRSLTIKGEVMKRRLLSIAVGGFAVVWMLASTAFAQFPGEPIRASIPFDFTIRGTTLPAGEYEISRIGDEPGALEIANIYHRGEHTVFETEPVQGPISSKGELVFHRYGDSYFLYEVWTPGIETGRELAPSHSERQLRREATVAGRAGQAETVAIAIN
jgi:hypothetical protein